MTRARGTLCLSSQAQSSTAPGATAISARACAKRSWSDLAGRGCWNTQAALLVELEEHLVFNLSYYLVPTDTPVVRPGIDFCQDVCTIWHSYALPAAPTNYIEASRETMHLQHVPCSTHLIILKSMTGMVNVPSMSAVVSPSSSVVRGYQNARTCDRQSKCRNKL